MKLYEMMNKQVANLAVLNTKLRHYHWYVTGPQFYGLHAKFEELFNYVMEVYDSVAERMLMLGAKPVASLKAYLELSTFVEVEGNLLPSDMVEKTLEDLKTLVLEFKETAHLAEEAKDNGTADIFNEAIGVIEKHLWMLGALLK